MVARCVVVVLAPVSLYRAVQRSLEVGSAGIVLATGLEVTEANRPRVPMGQTMYAPLIEAKQALGGAS